MRELNLFDIMHLAFKQLESDYKMNIKWQKREMAERGYVIYDGIESIENKMNQLIGYMENEKQYSWWRLDIEKAMRRLRKLRENTPIKIRDLE